MNYTGIILPIQKIWKQTAWSWAFRLAVSITVPLLYGYFTENLQAVFWVAFAAQSLGLIELKGNFGNVIRILVLGALFSLLTCTIGSLCGRVVWLHVVVMFFVGIISTLFKNLGERGLGMALGFYIFYIIASAYPTVNTADLWKRLELVALGQLWVIALAVVWMLVEKQGKPLRQTVSEVFFEMSVLVNKARSGFGGEGVLTSPRNLFLQETHIRNKLNASIEFFNIQDREIYNKQLVGQIRKIAGLLNIQLLQIIEEAHQLFPYRKQDNVDIHIHSILRIWEQLFNMTSEYLHYLKEDDKLWLQTRIERLADISLVIQETVYTSTFVQEKMQNIIRLSSRMAKLEERLMKLLDTHEEKRIFQSYTFSKMMKVLHPKMFGNELRNFFRFERNTSLYALRVGIGVLVGSLIDIYLIPHHGYWVPFTTIIVVQPYIGATVKKGFERSLGTFFGALLGYFLFEWLYTEWLNIALVAVATVFSIYYLKKKYSIASFFITLSLIGLLSISDNGGENILEIRLLCTVIGSSISIAVGFLFRSTWDESMLPIHFRAAILSNYEYLLASPVWQYTSENWLRLKRLAESANVRLFESYSRWTNEPKLKRDRKETARYFAKINHLIRLTKEINNINLEWELQTETPTQISRDTTQLMELFETLLKKFEIPIPPKIEIENFSPYINLSTEQNIAFNKIFLELRALLAAIEK